MKRWALKVEGKIDASAIKKQRHSYCCANTPFIKELFILLTGGFLSATDKEVNACKHAHTRQLGHPLEVKWTNPHGTIAIVVLDPGVVLALGDRKIPYLNNDFVR